METRTAAILIIVLTSLLAGCGFHSEPAYPEGIYQELETPGEAIPEATDDSTV